jgi:hypothetical protein
LAENTLAKNANPEIKFTRDANEKIGYKEELFARKAKAKFIREEKINIFIYVARKFMSLFH